MDLQDLQLKQLAESNEHLEAIHGLLAKGSDKNSKLEELVAGIGTIQSLKEIETILSAIQKTLETITVNTSEKTIIPEVNFESTNELLKTLIEESKKPCQVTLTLE